MYRLVGFLAIAVAIAWAGTASAQCGVACYQPVTTCYQPAAPCCQTTYYQPRTVYYAAAPVPRTVYYAAAPAAVGYAATPVVTTRYRPILGGTVSRVRYAYSPVVYYPY